MSGRPNGSRPADTESDLLRTLSETFDPGGSLDPDLDEWVNPHEDAIEAVASHVRRLEADIARLHREIDAEGKG